MIKPHAATLILSLTAMAACQKCYTCTQELPIAINGPTVSNSGVTIDNSTITREFCANPIEARLEVFEMEDEGFTCVEQ